MTTELSDYSEPKDSGRTILVVDDVSDNIILISLWLQDTGYRVVTANNGEDALTIAKMARPDLILMDIAMPQQDGLAATRRIREETELQDVPVIALTAFDPLDFIKTGGGIVSGTDCRGRACTRLFVPPFKSEVERKMKPKHYVLVFALALLAGFVGRSWPGDALAPLAAGARASAREESDGPKWEYCAVTKAQFPGSIRGGSYWIVYFRRSTVQVETVEAGVSENALSKAAFKLGEEGWEMVGEGPLEGKAGTPGATPNSLYFKRRKLS
ncbi:MAG: response regulator [Acidobacteria bacterium]|nr:response regulator [Acidobacteriota bacterium]